MVEDDLDNPSKYASKWSFIYLGVVIVNTFMMQLMGVDQNSIIKNFGYFVPAVIFLLLTQWEYRRSLGGYISYRQTFSAGFRYAVFSGLLFAVFYFAYLTFFSTEIDQSIADAQTKLAESGMSQEQIDTKIQFGKMYGPLFGAFFAAVETTVLGAIIAAIGAIIIKRERSIIDRNYDPSSTDGLMP